MLTSITPKLPMRNKSITQDYYVNQLGFNYIGSDDYEYYLIVEKDNLQIHFFEFKELNPLDNYGQVYIRTIDIYELYNFMLVNNVAIHPNGKLSPKPWQQIEFSLLDPDHNLLTFGQSM